MILHFLPLHIKTRAFAWLKKMLIKSVQFSAFYSISSSSIIFMQNANILGLTSALFQDNLTAFLTKTRKLSLHHRSCTKQVKWKKVFALILYVINNMSFQSASLTVNAGNFIIVFISKSCSIFSCVLQKKALRRDKAQRQSVWNLCF